MDIYIRMFDDLRRQVDDNPMIGIIFCTDKEVIEDLEQSLMRKWERLILLLIQH